MKEKALTKLTNVEFWIQHFDKSFTLDRIKQALEDGWDDLNEEERKVYYVGNDYDVGRGNFEDLH